MFIDSWRSVCYEFGGERNTSLCFSIYSFICNFACVLLIFITNSLLNNFNTVKILKQWNIFGHYVGFSVFVLITLSCGLLYKPKYF